MNKRIHAKIVALHANGAQVSNMEVPDTNKGCEIVP